MGFDHKRRSDQFADSGGGLDPGRWTGDSLPSEREGRPVTKQDRVFQDAQALILFGGIFLMLNGAARLLELLF
jgi:hypothetical protein